MSRGTVTPVEPQCALFQGWPRIVQAGADGQEQRKAHEQSAMSPNPQRPRAGGVVELTGVGRHGRNVPCRLAGAHVGPLNKGAISFASAMDKPTRVCGKLT